MGYTPAPVLRPIARLVQRLPGPLRRGTVRVTVDLLWRIFARLEVEGREHLPEGPCLFVANHLSNADGITLARALAPRRVFFLAGVKLKGTALTRLGLEAVDTIFIHPGTADIEALRRALEVLKSGDSVVLFPEGTRSRTGALQRARRGASLLALKGRVPVVPVALTGTESLLPIDDADMGGELLRRSLVRVRIGKPVDAVALAAQTPEGEEKRQFLVDALMRRIAGLLPPEYRGFYG